MGNDDKLKYTCDVKSECCPSSLKNNVFKIVYDEDVAGIAPAEPCCFRLWSFFRCTEMLVGSLLSTAGPKMWWILPAGFLITGGMIRDCFLCRECIFSPCSSALFLLVSKIEIIRVLYSVLIITAGNWTGQELWNATEECLVHIPIFQIWLDTKLLISLPIRTCTLYIYATWLLCQENQTLQSKLCKWNVFAPFAHS